MKHSPLPLSRRRFIGLSLGAAGLAAATRSWGQSASGGSRSARKLGVALVGLGRYSANELGPALKLTEHCHLMGVVTGTPSKVSEWRDKYGFPEKNVWSYDTMHQMAGNKDIDIVYVVTPNGLHARDAIAAAKAGKHVIIEKPMANTAAECDEILAVCRANNVKCSIGYRLHFDPYHQELMRLAREKDFGVLKKMKGDRGFVARTKAWRQSKTLAGGGALMDLGIYVIQGACMAADNRAPVAVTAQHIPTTKPDLFDEVEEGTRWTMEFPDGQVCEAFTSYNHTADTFRAEGDKGWIDFKSRAFTYRGAVVETSKGPLNYGPSINQQARQMDDFALCVRENRESRISGEMGRRDNAILDAIYEAARTGKRTLVKS